MDIKEAVGSVLKELIVPELDEIKKENKEIKATLILTNKRLDDINAHLADQSRRIDETNRRIDSVREELTLRIDSLREELTLRIDRLYEVVVRRDEHYKLDERVADLERDVNELKRMAA
jgi:chromosome segregation ATPase